MDDRQHVPFTSYPPDATGLERKMVQLSAAFGIITICAIIITMGLSMYLLPNAPPSLLGAPLF